MSHRKAALRSTIPARVAAYVDLCIAELAAASQDTRVELLLQRVSDLEASMQVIDNKLENTTPSPSLTRRQLRDLINSKVQENLNNGD